VTSGDEAVAAAAERAKTTAARNIPVFSDLPLPADTANLREGANLNDALLALLPLVGVWRGEGEVVYPTMDGPLHFGQQIVFAHDGRPFLTYSAQAWLLDGPGGSVVRPAHRETGWWRPQEDDTLEVLLAHATGIVEVYYGRPRSATSWELVTDAVVRTQTAKEVNTAQRLYGLVAASDRSNGSDTGRDLAYVDERAMVGQPLQPHLSARLQRIVG
jgi:hypothetical protein